MMKKKMSKILSLVLAMVMALSITAFAAENSKMTITGLGGVTVTFAQGSDEKIIVTYADEDLEGQYLIMMVTASDGVMNTPGANTILYIDQTEAKNGEISFEVYPSVIKDSVIVIYGLMPDGSKQLKAAIIDAMYILGDVDRDGSITAFDAVATLRAAAGIDKLDADQLAAAEVDGEAGLSAFDAVKILRVAADLESF